MQHLLADVSLPEIIALNFRKLLSFTLSKNKLGSRLFVLFLPYKSISVNYVLVKLVDFVRKPLYYNRKTVCI